MKQTLLAQSVNIGGTNITGPLVGINNLGDVVNKLIPFVMSFAGILLFLILVWGGFDFMTSQGDAAKIKSARAKITAGIIGFVLLLLSYLITRLLSFMFGMGEGII